MESAGGDLEILTRCRAAQKKCGTWETLRICGISAPPDAKTARQFKLLRLSYSHARNAHLGTHFRTATARSLKAIAGRRAWCIFERRLEPPDVFR